MKLLTAPRNPFGAPLFYKEITESTQDDVFFLASEGAPVGTAVWAGLQTKGRGRLEGRRWDGEAGLNLTFSFLTKGTGGFPLSLRWGLAVVRTLSTFGVSSQIKWPNDILVDGGKICGILVQARSGIQVTGIGLNVRQTEFPGSFRRPPQGLLGLGVDVTPGLVLGPLLEQLKEVYDHPPTAAHVQPWLWQPIQGLTVTDPWTKTEVSGEVAGLSDSGELLLKTPEGLRRIQSGESEASPV